MTRLRNPLRIIPTPMEGDFLKVVLDELDKAKATQVHERRKHQRIAHRSLRVVLITKESGGEVGFMVASRNVSQGGACLLHRQMLYPAEKCRVVFPLSGNRHLLVRARVVRCRFIQGILHEIGIRFERPIKREELDDVLSMHDESQDGPADTE